MAALHVADEDEDLFTPISALSNVNLPVILLVHGYGRSEL